MEFKKGDKTVSVPVLGFIAAASVVGVVATEICKVVTAKKTSKQVNKVSTGRALVKTTEALLFFV